MDQGHIRKHSALKALVLGQIPSPWSDRLADLVGHPAIIVESLVMSLQLVAAREVLAAAPSLRDDQMLLCYAR